MNGNPNTQSPSHGRSIWENNLDLSGNWWTGEKHKSKSQRPWETSDARKATKMLEFAMVAGVAFLASLYLVATYV